jgi:hydroxyacylglutathione hydrolase
VSESAAPVGFHPAAPTPGDLNVAWVHGSPSPRHRTDPPIQVHPYDPQTFILRESKDVSFEAPFLYLFLGDDRALLVDTGATADPARFPLRQTIDQLVRDWLVVHPRTEHQLVVAHTHSHSDHTAGDPQFSDRPNTQIVGRTTEAVREFFGLSGASDSIGRLDLGGRELEVFPIPGHHPASIALYDRRTGFLLTGDTVCPGRLYVFDMPAFLTSLDQLVRFAGAQPVTHVLGAHIEMTQWPGRDYPIGAKYQPHERPLPLPVERLTDVRLAAKSAAARPGAYWFDDFVIFNGPCIGPVVRQLVRGKFWNLRYRLGLLRGTPG